MEEISAFKFPACRHLGSHDVTVLPLLLESLEVLLFEIIGQRFDVIKSEMAASGKFKSRNLFQFIIIIKCYVSLV